jgi:hypothetical protein
VNAVELLDSDHTRDLQERPSCEPEQISLAPDKVAIDSAPLELGGGLDPSPMPGCRLARTWFADRGLPSGASRHCGAASSPDPRHHRATHYTILCIEVPAVPPHVVCLKYVDSVMPALLALLMNFAKAILYPLTIFTVSSVLQALADLVFPIPEALAMLPVLVIVPITLAIFRGRRLTISRGRRLALTRGRWGLARARHSQLTNSGYGDLSLSVGWR